MKQYMDVSINRYTKHLFKHAGTCFTATNISIALGALVLCQCDICSLVVSSMKSACRNVINCTLNLKSCSCKYVFKHEIGQWSGLKTTTLMRKVNDI